MKIARTWNHDAATELLLEDVVDALERSADIEVDVRNDDGGTIVVRSEGRTFNLTLTEVV